MFNFKTADQLDSEQTHALYEKFSNQRLPSLYSRFLVGNTKFVRAEGPFLYTDNSDKIFDFTGGLGVANFGHNHPRILGVRKQFLNEQMVEIHKSYLNRFLAAASYNLAQILPGDLQYSFFCNSGAEAVDGALKLSYRAHRGKRSIVLRSDISFHGKTIGAGSLSSGDNFVAGKARFSFQKIQGVKTFTYNDIESVQNLISAHKSDVYALFVEPFSCSTLTEATPEFLKKIRAICSKNKIVLVFDEIYSGFGKCGPNFYMEKYGVIPDLVCISKALGGGKASISAYVATEEIFKRAYGTTDGALLHSTTYNSFGEECVTAMEACNILVEEEISKKALKLETILKEELRKLQNKHATQIEEIRGAGSHFGVLFKSRLLKLKPLLALIPVPFVQDPNFLNKLIVTSLIDEFFHQHKCICAFTANKSVFLNFSPAPITTPELVAERIRSFDSVLEHGIENCVRKFIERNLRK